MSDIEGTRLGQYQLVSVIGQGGMATVYKALQPSIKRHVAIKVIDSRLSQDTEFVKRFALEAQTIASLSHTHILKVFDFGVEGDQAYLVMELLRGGTLARIIQRGPIPAVNVSKALDQIASAVDYAHSRGIVHRDLKPGNLMIDDSGSLLLTDFGMAKLVNETGGLTQTGMAMGTPVYMSPEQWQSKGISPRSDVYSLGVIVFEMLAGRPPFDGNTAYRLMYQHLMDIPPMVTGFRPDLPDEVDAVLNRALCKSEEDRFPSAGAFAHAFRQAFQSSKGATLAQPIGMKPTIRLDTIPPMPLKRVILTPGTTRTDDKGIPQVWTPAGGFQMGSDSDPLSRSDEHPHHKVCLNQPFWLDQYPVTNAAFQEFIDAGGYHQRDLWSNAGWQWLSDTRITSPGNYPRFLAPNQPRVGISWYEADAYARWRGGRLPTEAEWEYAARGPESRIYPWGNEFRPGKATVDAKATTLVESHPDGASWVGACDLAGNVWEWTFDWYDELIYQADNRNDPTGPTAGRTKTLRGGAFMQGQVFARSACRRHESPTARENYIGMRVLIPATR